MRYKDVHAIVLTLLKSGRHSICAAFAIIRACNRECDSLSGSHIILLLMRLMVRQAYWAICRRMWRQASKTVRKGASRSPEPQTFRCRGSSITRQKLNDTDIVVLRNRDAALLGTRDEVSPFRSHIRNHGAQRSAFEPAVVTRG